MVDPFGWHQVDAETIQNIRTRLSDFESMTWNEILNKGRSENHQIKIDSICKAARDRLVERKLNDIDEVCSLRVGGKKRVFGILDSGILRLLWYDPDHQICPSPKKHT